MVGFNCLCKCARYFSLFPGIFFCSETVRLLLRIIFESFFLTSNTCGEYVAVQPKSGQMLQAVKQSLTWIPESFDGRFPVSVNSFIESGVPTFV